ncbi:hypothetical protein A3D81_00410 [Candidatus Curtissbacteria bacterium RIFCSPHIGHO2_02_FULL_40_17]|uniref:Uncharacterized protein n=4 Tax=Microgenomates group TaxID=1794810 RepID=A0A1F7K1Q8_9BACT|nr:MAG: hypothetical protein A3D81_00410 [Candidatus Curtissbacteria bacterium RIFCSPHIGHO2_02_FULL_40_17]OGK37586.1 MAG: hypothetical protein A3F32_01025 [Candidatus Roizmanbacteria bacterium RIFCSPHIGHO2_12_FULL_42_10]OGK51630.1 MAG: hypothetical protein A3B02_00650 [Candidatus Roizmanbacteria bacterium RIFCSPLOWO2_01_FULL_42_14]OGK61819.1 MAG: hypothetical protein A3I56_04195 [Candidatus Roizmanbacteria bacterium RIFCSPLOWO2_02_FULL_43_10]
MILRRLESVSISPVAPFNFDATFHKPDHFTSVDNKWQPGALKDVSEEELRSLRVGYRARSIEKIDDNFANGSIDEMKCS